MTFIRSLTIIGILILPFTVQAQILDQFVKNSGIGKLYLGENINSIQNFKSAEQSAKEQIYFEPFFVKYIVESVNSEISKDTLKIFKVGFNLGEDGKVDKIFISVNKDLKWIDVLKKDCGPFNNSSYFGKAENQNDNQIAYSWVKDSYILTYYSNNGNGLDKSTYSIIILSKPPL